MATVNLKRKYELERCRSYSDPFRLVNGIRSDEFESDLNASGDFESPSQCIRDQNSQSTIATMDLLDENPFKFDVASQKWADLSIYTDIFSPPSEEEPTLESPTETEQMAYQESFDQSLFSSLSTELPALYEDEEMAADAYFEPEVTYYTEAAAEEGKKVKRRHGHHRISMKPVSASTLSVLKLNLLKKKSIRESDNPFETGSTINLEKKSSKSKKTKSKRKAKKLKSQSSSEFSMDNLVITNQLMQTFTISEDRLYCFDSSYQDSSLVFSEDALVGEDVICKVKLSPSKVSSFFMESIARNAKLASKEMAVLSLDERNSILKTIHALLNQRSAEIFSANKADLDKAEQLVNEGTLSPTLAKRLDIRGKNDEKFKALLRGISSVVEMSDPLGKVTLARELDEGLNLYRKSCPIGVSLIIFESRPEVVVQISSLIVKSGNACILKGGKEAAHTNSILVQIFQEGIQAFMKNQFLPIQLVDSREAVNELLKLDKFIDLVIPRGSNQLVRFVKQNTTIPVLGHADGLCAIFINHDADLNICKRVIVDSKANYPSACNSVETLLIHKNAVDRVLLEVCQALGSHDVKLRVTDELYDRVSSFPFVRRATPDDFDTEFMDLVLAVKQVDSVQEAIDHINAHGSGHTDCILTANDDDAELFLNSVDSAGVYCNASTRFADGFRYGFGAEIGISTNKTHARGPVGLEGLTIYKYILKGHGHIVSDYTDQGRQYTHIDLQ